MMAEEPQELAVDALATRIIGEEETVLDEAAPSAELFELVGTPIPTATHQPEIERLQLPPSTETASPADSQGRLPFGISEIFSNVSTVRLLEVVVGAAAVAMWVVVWLLRRR